MTIRRIRTYAVWIRMPKSKKQEIEEKIEKLFSYLLNSTLENSELCPIRFANATPKEVSSFVPWIKIRKEFYLLHTHPSWSPGDICGAIRSKELIAPEDEIIAFSIDPPSYIPWQGIHDGFELRGIIEKWKEQYDWYYFKDIDRRVFS